MNRVFRMLWFMGIIVVLLGAAGIYYAATPNMWRVGYTPEQSVPFSHKLHVSELGMDCAACHASAPYSKKAGSPDAHSCLACHKHIQPDSPKLTPLQEAANPQFSGYTGQSLRWKKVHSLPDHAVFVHSAHINRGVACETCHGNVAQADRISVKASLSMAWCLECHRNPTPFLRPLETVTEQGFDWDAFLKKHGSPNDSPETWQKKLAERWKINPPTDCTSCHQ